MRRRLPHAVLFATGLILAGLAPAPASAAPAFSDPLFVWSNATPGFTWELPTNVAFLPGGRMLVTEKTGKVWAVVNGVKGAAPMLDISAEVLNQHDRGLLGIAVDPNYLSNHHLYLLYTVDPDSNNVDTNDDAFSRLSRFTVSFADSNVIPYSSRVVLFGHNWRSGPVSTSPSHTIGDLHFGRDGTLLVSSGDGAQFSLVDKGGNDAGAFGATKTDPYEDIGAFRAQYIGSLCGKILRIDPTTGFGVPSNPFYESANPGSAQSRVWAYGVRNPFRFKLRPGTGSTNPADGNPGVMYLSDVGYNTYEEINVSPNGGLNFGWPCYEGAGPQSGYQGATPSHHGCSTIGTSINPSVQSSPLTWWHHSTGSSSSPSGIVGNCATGGAFYTGGVFPVSYAGRYFYLDYGQSWMRVATVNASDQLTATQPFATGLEGPVDVEVDPVTGELVYVAITAQQVRRIRYTGTVGNAPPIANATGTPLLGGAPLDVSFSSSGSFDPNGDPITIGWSFGDGQGSTLSNPSHTYAQPGSYDAVLTVTDDKGAFARDTLIVIVTPSGFPSAGVLDEFNRPNGAIGGAWVDQTNGLAISTNRLVQTCCTPSTVWSGQAFGPNQEAYIRFLAVTPGANEQDLMLKVQGLSYATGHIEVRWDANFGQVRVATHTAATGWTQRAAFPSSFAPGDQLGARTYADGTIQVFKNGALIGATSTGDWPYTANGGYLGMTFDGATSSQLDDFGGGNVVFDANTPPVAAITSPADGAFYRAQVPVAFTASATDGQQAANTLSYVWTVDMHHNNHVHPGAYVATGADTLYEPEDHDDGTGVWAEVRLVVTDAGGLKDTATVAIFPEIDLAPTLTSLSPDPPVTGAPLFATFRIHNLGVMPAQVSKWRLLLGAATIAEADTTIPGGDSLLVKYAFLPGELPAGPMQLRLVADTLGAITEVSEANNALTVSRTVLSGGATGVGDAPPARLAIGEPRPNPSPGAVAFALELPGAAAVALEVFDAQGRLVHSAPERTFAAGHHDLRWDGMLDGRRRAPVGLYWARVTVDGRTFARRVALLR